MRFDADLYTNAQEEKLSRLPVCSCCKQPIQDETFIITPKNEKLCSECEFENARDLWLEFGRDEYVMLTERFV